MSSLKYKMLTAATGTALAGLALLPATAAAAAPTTATTHTVTAQSASEAEQTAADGIWVNRGFYYSWDKSSCLAAAQEWGKLGYWSACTAGWDKSYTNYGWILWVWYEV